MTATQTYTYPNANYDFTEIQAKHNLHILCHGSLKNDALPSLNVSSFEQGLKTIFFHETSCRGGLSLRQGCCIESAARLHPKWQVFVLFNSPVSSKILKASILWNLLQIPNIKVARIMALEHSKDTILHSTIATQLWRSQHPVEHAADLMRIITLNKYGGVYLDLDQLLVKPLDDLPQNWIAKETYIALGSGAMAFAKDEIGKNLTDAVMREIFNTFNVAGTTHNGPEAFERVMKSVCGNQTVKSSSTCMGISILDPKLFYPVTYRWAHKYFQVSKIKENNYSYAHHLWGMMTKIYNFNDRTPFAGFAKKFCPSLYKVMHKRIRWRYLVSDMSCHYAEYGDALPSAEDESFSPKSNSIYFHETSCRGGLTSRQACSVESAARIHPNREVYVLFSAPVNDYILKRSCLAKLLQFDNIKAARVHIDIYAKGTTVEPILLDLEESKFPVQHASDILRILTLNKFGGIYLDTDMIVVKSLDELPPNWVAKQSDFSLASGILSFAKDEVGRNVTRRILELISQTFNPYDWSVNGPYAVQKAVLHLCMTGNHSENCNGCVLFLLIMNTAKSEMVQEDPGTTEAITSSVFDNSEPEYPGTLPEYVDKLQDFF
ncbi:unnamed protein product [Chrysodeixis includens]|uniref:Alpha 1,4-glycosyltransferase domain-containing protein n=1 Tax=Chrysodeixis includens TaxID=689277 RepID=A0A9N8KUT7_CHRIL|nr:unnamed protein product [Chrysodeixis includens]